jgi:hypothetical protein
MIGLFFNVPFGVVQYFDADRIIDRNIKIRCFKLFLAFTQR